MRLPEQQLPRAIARLSPPLITLAIIEAALRFHSFAGQHYRAAIVIAGLIALAGLAIHVNLITREPRRNVFVAYAIMHAPMLYQAWIICLLLMRPMRA
jgi:hypothetical protein